MPFSHNYRNIAPHIYVPIRISGAYLNARISQAFPERFAKHGMLRLFCIPKVSERAWALKRKKQTLGIVHLPLEFLRRRKKVPPRFETRL